jgi:hypothetical protein
MDRPSRPAAGVARASTASLFVSGSPSGALLIPGQDGVTFNGHAARGCPSSTPSRALPSQTLQSGIEINGWWAYRIVDNILDTSEPSAIKENKEEDPIGMILVTSSSFLRRRIRRQRALWLKCHNTVTFPSRGSKLIP